jgi:hypothetical protein
MNTGNTAADVPSTATATATATAAAATATATAAAAAKVHVIDDELGEFFLHARLRELRGKRELPPSPSSRRHFVHRGGIQTAHHDEISAPNSGPAHPSGPVPSSTDTAAAAAATAVAASSSNLMVMRTRGCVEGCSEAMLRTQ